MHTRLALTAAAVLAAASIAPAQDTNAVRQDAPAPQPRPRRLHVEAEIGVAWVNGTSYERVYVPIEDGRLEGRTHKLSELVWDIQDVYGVRGSLALLSWDGRLEFRATVFSAVSAGDGGMVDYDWFLYDRPDFWTHRSRSTVDVDYGIEADFRGIYRFLDKAPVTLGVALGIRSMAWKWTDHGIDYSYSTLGGDPSPDYTYQQIDPTALRDDNGTDASTGIIYEEFFLVPYIGMVAAIREGQFRADAYLLFSNLAAAEDRDQHLIRELEFSGRFSGGTYLAYGLAARYDLTPRLFCSASFEAQSVSEIRGDMTIRTADGTYAGTAPNAAGIEHESRQVALALGIRL